MKNQDELYTERTSASTVQEIFESAESEIDNERVDALDEEDAKFVNSDVASKPIKHGDINLLYADYIAAKNNANGSLQSRLAIENARDILLADAANYALRLFGRKRPEPSLNGLVGEDIAQDVAIKVLKNLDNFRGESKFSKWLYDIVENTVKDAIRKQETRKESPFNGDVLCFETKTNVEITASGTRAKSYNSKKDYDGVKTDLDDDDSGSAVLPPSVLYAELNSRTLDIALQDVLPKLSAQDKHICKLRCEGYSPSEIAKALGLEIKQTYNRIAKLQETLKHELCVLEVVLHTCRLSVTSVQPNKKIIGYISDGKDFRALPLTCRCRKGVTRKEARQLLETGDAQEVCHLNKDGELVRDEGRIWATQSVRVPRCGLAANSKAGMEKACIDKNYQVSRDIEIAHEITLAERAKLIVYEEDLIARGINPHEWDGRAVLRTYSAQREQRPSLGKNVDTETLEPLETWVPTPSPSSYSPEKPLVIEQGYCPRCKEPTLSVGIYSDGSQHHECFGWSRFGPCGYLMVWSSKASRSPVSVVEQPIAVLVDSATHT